MKEGLRSSTLCKRGKANADSGQQNVAGGGKKGLNLNSPKSALFNDSSPYSLRSKGQKERKFEHLECDHKADAASDETGGAECNADVGEKGNLKSAKSALFNDSSPYLLRSKGKKERETEHLEPDHNDDAGSDNTSGAECNAVVADKGFSVFSSEFESDRDLVTTANRNVEERGDYEQVACSNDADHGSKEEGESLLVPNGLDPDAKNEIRLQNLIPTHSLNSLEHEKDADLDADTGGCLSSMNGDGAVFSNVDEDNESENADAYLDVAKTRHDHGSDSRGIEREVVDCPMRDGVFTSDVGMMQMGSSLNSKDQESAQDPVISSERERFERSANKRVVYMANGDDELAVKENGDASAVAEKGENVDSQIGDNPAADKCLKEERVSPPASVVLDSVQEVTIFNIDINVEATSGSENIECLKDADVHDGEVTAANIDVKANGESDEGMLRLGKRKRGRKRKEERISECNEDGGSGKKKVKKGEPQITAMVMRSRTATMSGGNQEVDGGSNGCVLGGKRKIKTECPDQDEINAKNDETDQHIQKPGKKLKRRGRPRKVLEEYSPSTLLHEKEVKDTEVSNKVKPRGRPPKVKKELLPSKVINENNLKHTVPEIVKRRGRPPKVKKELLPSKVINENNLKHTVPEIRKGRGRPPKVLGGKASQVIHKSKPNDMAVPKKLKRRGRPPKVQEEDLASQVMHKNKLKDLVASMRLKRVARQPNVLGRNLASQAVRRSKLKSLVPNKAKRRGRPPKVLLENSDPRVNCKDETTDMVYEGSSNQLEAEGIVEIFDEEVRKENGISEAPNDKRQKVKGEAKDAHIGHSAGKSIVKKKSKKKKPKGEVEMGRREQKQLVRDQINSMILDAGWKIDYRPRQSKDYEDAVYVDSEEKTHWSSTKAYRCLKRRVEDGVANDREVAAFSVIPEEAFSTLFRHTDKDRPRKGKKANKLGKGAGQTDKGTTSKEQKMNKPGKKGKNGSKLKGDRFHSRKQAASSLKGRSKPRLLARSSSKGSNQDSDVFSLFNRKRSLLSWMIDLGTILPGSKVSYGSIKRKKIRCEGTVNRDGIKCGCCDEIMSISDFEAHASGSGKLLGQPYNNICLESGTSLSQCMLDSWRKEKESRHIKFNSVDIRGDDPNDDTCNICGDGGDLICCDGCPSTFHQSCLDIQNFPSGDWHCVYCSCKFCGMAAVNNTPTDCSDPVVSELLSCNLCEEKFHQPCSQGEEAVNVASVRASFCGSKCQEIFERLQMYTGVRHELEEGFSWTLLQCSDVSEDLSAAAADALKVELNSKLTVAFSIMDECFVPIIDQRSGINIIQNVIYNCGSNFRRMNYGTFCTAILERGDDIISAASIRIHGNKVAEMPFIGTRNVYRRQGMCRRLLNAIESALGSLDVEKLVIPAISEMLQTWTSVFGFKPLEEHKRKELKGMSLIVFPGTDMLEKPLLNPRPAEGNTITSTDKQWTEHQTVSSPDSDSNAFSKLINGDSSLHLPDRFLNDTPKLTDLNLSYEDNPLEVSNDCSYDNGHLIPSDVNIITKPQSGCASVVLDKSVEVQSSVDNDGIMEVKASSLACSVGATRELTSENATKVTFDLNKDLAAAETDSDSAPGDSLPIEPQGCAKEYELSDSGPLVDKPAGSLCDSDPCTTQPLVLV